MKDIVEQITLVMFLDLFQTRTTNNVVFTVVENKRSKTVKNSGEVMSRRDGAPAGAAQTMFFMYRKPCGMSGYAKFHHSMLHKNNIVMDSVNVTIKAR
jgi:hypothetical protein